MADAPDNDETKRLQAEGYIPPALPEVKVGECTPVRSWSLGGGAFLNIGEVKPITSIDPHALANRVMAVYGAGDHEAALGAIKSQGKPPANIRDLPYGRNAERGEPTVSPYRFTTTPAFNSESLIKPSWRLSAPITVAIVACRLKSAFNRMLGRDNQPPTFGDPTGGTEPQ